jgi:hypothetical protein
MFAAAACGEENRGSRSSSSGIGQPPGDTLVRDQQIYETPHE